ncbi:MAG: hypothetical protein MJ093_06600 [Saccharofermentans sp.]|nr:hypothetical protein [Saccharofermentans sp.]
MKKLVNFLTDESPKMLKKIDKMLENNSSAQYYDALKQEIQAGNEVDVPGIGLCVTNSYLVYYKFGIGATLYIIPISNITNLYRTNMDNEYLYDAFFLAIEKTDGQKQLICRYPRNGKKSLDIYNQIIDAVKSKIAIQGGAQ